ncbi:PTS IIA-like nitrogen regulatory protein PtsN [Treponema sp.]
MILFSTILNPQCAATGVVADDKDAALVAAVDLLAASGKVNNVGKLLEEIRSREHLASTAIGEGVAVPHALCDALSETLLAVLHLAHPVDFDSIDGSPVDLLFLMAGPKGDTANHLKLLSKIARLLHDGDFRSAAREAPDGKSLAALLYEKD